MKAAAMELARGNGQPRLPRLASRENDRPIQRTGGREAADRTEVEADIAAAGSITAENAAAENGAVDDNTEMAASGTAPPMIS
jgi:hypothetical protein